MNNGKYVVAKFDASQYECHLDASGYLIIEHKFEAETWAARVLKQYEGNYYFCNMGAGVLAARQRREGGCAPKAGMAICNPKDKFCLEVGKAIAICRAEGIKIPDEIFRK